MTNLASLREQKELRYAKKGLALALMSGMIWSSDGLILGKGLAEEPFGSPALWLFAPLLAAGLHDFCAACLSLAINGAQGKGREVIRTLHRRAAGPRLPQGARQPQGVGGPRAVRDRGHRHRLHPAGRGRGRPVLSWDRLRVPRGVRLGRRGRVRHSFEPEAESPRGNRRLLSRRGRRCFTTLRLKRIHLAFKPPPFDLVAKLPEIAARLVLLSGFHEGGAA